jgi:tetratricopeptide (TPR) repeat protein
VTAVAAALVAVLSVLTWKQIGYWKSSYDLWARTLSVTRNNLLANINFGDALRESGRPQEALTYFERAVTLNPPDPNIHVKVAVALVESGRVEEAISEYQTAIHLTPDPSIVGPSFESIAALYTSLGDYAKVRESYQQALETDSRMGPVMIRHLSDWVAHQPTAGGYVSLGLLLQETGDISKAREAYRQALKVDPTFVSAKELLESAGG